MFHVDRGHARAAWSAVFVTMLWSSSWLLIRIGLDDESLSPLTFAGLRYTLAATALLGWAMARPRPRAELVGLTAATWRRLIVLGVVFYAITQGAQFIAIDSQPAATSSLLLAPTPLFVAVLSRRSIGESVQLRQVLGAALIVLGAVLFFAGDLDATGVGIVASVVGLSANVAGALLGRSVNGSEQLAPITVTVVSMTMGAVILLTAGVIAEGWPRVGWRAIVLVCWLAVVNTALAFTIWNTALRRLSAVQSSAINNTMLIQIAVLAWVVLGEAPGFAGAIGIAIVSAGALLAHGIGASRRPTSAQPRRPGRRASRPA